MQVERDLLEFEAAGFEPGEVEQIIEHAQQAPPRLIKRLAVARLGGVERAGQ